MNESPSNEPMPGEAPANLPVDAVELSLVPDQGRDLSGSVEAMNVANGNPGGLELAQSEGRDMNAAMRAMDLIYGAPKSPQVAQESADPIGEAIVTGTTEIGVPVYGIAQEAPTPVVDPAQAVWEDMQRLKGITPETKKEPIMPIFAARNATLAAFEKSQTLMGRVKGMGESIMDTIRPTEPLPPAVPGWVQMRERELAQQSAEVAPAVNPPVQAAEVAPEPPRPPSASAPRPGNIIDLAIEREKRNAIAEASSMNAGEQVAESGEAISMLAEEIKLEEEELAIQQAELDIRRRKLALLRKKGTLMGGKNPPPTPGGAPARNAA